MKSDSLYTRISDGVLELLRERNEARHVAAELLRMTSCGSSHPVTTEVLRLARRWADEEDAKEESLICASKANEEWPYLSWQGQCRRNVEGIAEVLKERDQEFLTAGPGAVEFIRYEVQRLGLKIHKEALNYDGNHVFVITMPGRDPIPRECRDCKSFKNSRPCGMIEAPRRDLRHCEHFSYDETSWQRDLA